MIIKNEDLKKIRSITIHAIDRIVQKTSDKGNKYERFQFVTSVWTKDGIEYANVGIRTNVSTNQAKELLKKINARFDDNEISIEPIDIKVNIYETTPSKEEDTPKPIFKIDNGVYEDVEYEYLSMHKAILLDQKLISSEKFQEDYSRFQ